MMGSSGWILLSKSAETYRPFLRDVFKFHPLSIDDALQETHVPKVDEWDTYLYMVLRTVKTEPQDTFEIRTPELDIFLGPNYLVTYHEEPIAAVEKIWTLCHQDHRYLSKGAGYLLYHIADEMVTNTMTMIEELDDQIDQIEDEIFNNPQPRNFGKYLFSQAGGIAVTAIPSSSKRSLQQAGSW